MHLARLTVSLEISAPQVPLPCELRQRTWRDASSTFPATMLIKVKTLTGKGTQRRRGGERC